MTRLPKAFLTLPLAHRGLHGPNCAENSLEAFEAALEAGYGIELDVQGTRDGHAVVFHDSTLDRMTDETGLVRDRSLEEMQAIPLKGGGSIIALDALLARVNGQVPVLVEIKDCTGTLERADDLLEAAVARSVKDHGNVAVMSFNPSIVGALATRLPDTPRGLVTEVFTSSGWPHAAVETLDRLSRIEDYDTVGASFISHDHASLDTCPVAELKARGSDILCWTIKSPEDEARARKVAQNITFEGYRPAVPGS